MSYLYWIMKDLEGNVTLYNPMECINNLIKKSLSYKVKIKAFWTLVLIWAHFKIKKFCLHWAKFIIIPPANKVWGYIGITLSVHLFVRLFTSCPGNNFVLPCPIWIWFHTIVANDLRVCHDLDPRSYLQGQGHSAHILEIRVQAITPHCQVRSG